MAPGMIVPASLPIWAANGPLSPLATNMHLNADASGTSHNGDARYNLLLETITEGLIETDDVPAFVHVNHRFATLLGYMPEELIEQPVTRFLAEDAARSFAGH